MKRKAPLYLPYIEYLKTEIYIEKSAKISCLKEGPSIGIL